MNEYVINVGKLETRIALLEDERLAELTIERHERRTVVGNIYKGLVDSIVPGIQAAFIDIGLEKNGFLYVSDIAGAEGTGDFDADDFDNLARSRAARARQNRIEKILSPKQAIMVQVEKDTLGTKGVRLTNFVTLPGRYVVLMPTVSQIGVSRKIEDPKERDRLKKILRSFRGNRQFGLIARTAAENKPKEAVEADLSYLNRIWERTKRKMERGKSEVVLLHEDLRPVQRTIRDHFTDDIGRLTIDDETEYQEILRFLEIFAEHLKDRCKLYNNKRPIFDKTGIETQLESAMQRRVSLKSGGHIVIDQTEALVAIDVNTGKFTGKRNLEDTVFKTNMDAAEEVARQIRLRDMGGIIVVDFIDMDRVQNRRKLLAWCEECLRKDRAKTTVSDVTELGMVEMTRKRVKHNLVAALSQTCPYCEGTGLVRSVTTMTAHCLRLLQKLFCKSREKKVILQVHPDVSRRLRGEDKELLDTLAAEFQREVVVESVSDFHIHHIQFLSGRNRELLTAD